MQIPYHLSIIHSEINSFFILGFVIICWLLYNRKCVAYFETIIYKYRSSFLCEVQALNEKKLLLMVIVSHIIVFLPVSIYASIVAYIAFLQNKFIVSAIIILSIFLITLISSLHVKNLLVNLTSMPGSIWPQNQFRRFIVPYFFYPMYYILYEKKMSAFALKIFSFLLFI